MTIVRVLLSAATVVLWIASTASLSDLHGSDAAGNGLALAFAVVASGALWLVLVGLLALSAARDRWPAWTRWAALVLVPAAAAACAAAVVLLSNTFYRSSWPLVVVAALPALLVAWTAWTARRRDPSVPSRVPAVLWGAVVVLSVLPWPACAYRLAHEPADRARAAEEERRREPERREAERREAAAAFERLGPGSPLEAWLPFIEPGSEWRPEALRRIRGLPRRQAEAEALFRGGDTSLQRDLPELDLQATPPVCDGSVEFLREVVRQVTPGEGAPPAIEKVQAIVVPSLPGLEWMAAHGCACAPIVAEIERVVRRYADSPARAAVLAELDAIGRQR